MKKCYLCGMSDDETALYEGIHKLKGIVNVCRKCYFKEKIPLINKKELNLEEINSKESVRERLLRISHLDSNERKTEKINPNIEDKTLKSIIKKNLKKEFSEGIKFPDDLVDNFNWRIMRKRRSLKITKEKMAEEISEPVLVLKNLENGILPKNYIPLIHKVEGYLKIKIFKNGGLNYQSILTESKVPSGILISDLREKSSEEKEKYLDASNLNLEKINNLYGVPNEINPKDNQKESNEKNSNKEDVSKLVWGNK